MPRKDIVKAVLSKEQRAILSEIARRLGTSESETMRTALMNYAKELGILQERIQRAASSSLLQREFPRFPNKKTCRGE